MKWLIIIFFIFFTSEAQVKRSVIPRTEKRNLSPLSIKEERERQQVFEIFKNIEQGIKNSSISYFDTYLGKSLLVNIGSSDRGNYSINQAVSILSEYFSYRRLISFEFSLINNKSEIPFATGSMNFLIKGNQETAQIYVSLIRQDTSWIINQFNIY